MSPRTVLDQVARATQRRTDANHAYRAAIVGAKESGASLHAIARAAGTSAPNILRIIRRATKGDTAS